MKYNVNTVHSFYRFHSTFWQFFLALELMFIRTGEKSNVQSIIQITYFRPVKLNLTFGRKPLPEEIVLKKKRKKLKIENIIIKSIDLLLHSKSEIEKKHLDLQTRRPPICVSAVAYLFITML